MTATASTAMYYWRGKPNFGDRLGPLLLRHYSGIACRWAAPPDSNLVMVGSVLHNLPNDWRGVIAGAGTLKEWIHPNLPNATVMAVRGPLTARDFKGDFVLGDPGLLADELVLLPTKLHRLGLVPHWSDPDLEHRPDLLKYDPLIIRPQDDPLDVIRQIGSCYKIVASSLHGIILADAFGIPRRIEETPRVAHEGGNFKFRDHDLAVGIKDTEFGVTKEAPRHIVQDRQHELFDMLEALPAVMRELRAQA